jgi:ferredoxin, 2Fe-2S
MIAFEIVSCDGAVQRLTGQLGDTIRDIAVEANHDGIPGVCGGFLACGTCHVIVDEIWAVRVGEADGEEAFLLNGTLSRQKYSRLACQLTLDAVLDGLIVHIPQA